MASQKPTDKDFKKQILTFASDTSKELSDTDTKAPSTFSSQTQSDTISFSESFLSMPREIPIELSLLFEKKLQSLPITLQKLAYDVIMINTRCDYL